MSSQQRPTISKSDLREQLELILMESVPSDGNGPNMTMLRKASSAADRIMRLVELYAGR